MLDGGYGQERFMLKFPAVKKIQLKNHLSNTIAHQSLFFFLFLLHSANNPIAAAPATIGVFFNLLSSV